LVVFVDFESLEVLFRNLNLDRVRDVLMGAYHRFGAGRPPFNPLGLLRFKVVLVLKGYRSQRALEREVRVDSRVKGLCGFDAVPSHSTVVRFERRIGVDRLKKLIRRIVEGLVSCGFIKGLKVVLDSKPFKARCRRDPKNPSRGWLDAEARLGRGVRGFVMGYKVHLACDGESDMPLSFTVAPANENDKQHAISVLSEAAERVNVEAVICDKQYSSRKIRKFIKASGAEPVIPYPANQKRGVKGLLRVDKKFRVHGSKRLKRLYLLRSSVERVNSRLASLLSRITFKGLKAAATQVSYAVLGILFIAWTAVKTGRPEKARSITYYV
jgi:IS5 family transposase